MTLQIQVQVPGMIKVNYPYQGQSITSFVKLAGSVAALPPNQLPHGIGYIQQQLPQNLQGSVLNSHALFGKRYFLKRLTYYCDGTAVREVDYVADEIASYQFTDDYLGTVYGDTLAPGDHRFTVLATFFSPQNPGVDIYDVFDIPFVFADNSENSILPYLNNIGPQQFVGEIDHQIFTKMFDFVLTQRAEGALKNDIDYIGTLYDLDNVPKTLIPYLAKTIGYDYFAGLMGNDNTIRDELKFLPEWQKSVGTKESILVLLRALSLNGEINPLYLDLTNNVLVRGVKRRYEFQDTLKVVAQTKRARFTFPLTHSTFVDNTVRLSMKGLDGTVYANFIWDVAKNKAHWLTFDSTSTWLVHADGSHVTVDDVAQVYADRARGGVTIVFTSAVKTVVSLEVMVDYQYDFESHPGRNTRLSEFFRVKIMTLSKPNDFPAKDFSHIIDIIKRSKPLRTKLEGIEFPFSYADAYMFTPMSVSSTGSMANLDRLSDFNIDKTATNLRNPVVESVDLRATNLMSDGFLFTWENCGVDDNRFAIQGSLAIEPSLHGEAVKEMLVKDGLARRNFALIVGDDKTYVGDDRKRYLRQIGLRINNAKPCTTMLNVLSHGQTLKNLTMVSPAVVTASDLVTQLDGPEVYLNVDLTTDPVSRYGNSVHYVLGDATFDLWDLNVGSSIGTYPFDIDTVNLKQVSFSWAFADARLTIFRCTNEAELEAVWTARPNLRNYRFPLNVWHAVWDITGDFFANPIHLSTFYTEMLTPNKTNCCCIGVGTVAASGGEPVFGVAAYGDFNAPEFNRVVFNSSDLENTSFIGNILNFNFIVGKAYQFETTFDIEIYSLTDGSIVGRYRWNGAYWNAVQSFAYIDVALNPASISFDSDLVISGTMQYIGPVPSGITNQWGVRLCAPLVGDNMFLDVSSQFQDDFSASMKHNGMFGLKPEGDYLGVPIGSLVDHLHDQGGQRMVAYDGVYMRNGIFLPAFTMTLTIPASNVFIWDGPGEWDNPEWRWDSGNTNDQVKFHDFPKKVVMEMVP